MVALVLAGANVEEEMRKDVEQGLVLVLPFCWHRGILYEIHVEPADCKAQHEQYLQ